MALRLRRFLDATRDVDFTAKLVDQNKQQKFADPAFEAKPGEWKLCFRAGKPATDAAREFARKWVADLQSQGVK